MRLAHILLHSFPLLAMPESVGRTPLAEDQAAGAMALLVIDMLSGWDFPDAEKLVGGALRIAPQLVAIGS